MRCQPTPDRPLGSVRAEDVEPTDSGRFLATLIGNLPGMVYRCENDPQWPFTFVSEGCRDITGWTGADFVERRIELGTLIVPEDRQRIWDEVQVALRARRPYLLTYRILTRDQRERWLWEKGCGVFTTSGDLECLEGVILDISQQKALEEQLLQAHKLEAVGRLAGGVAHDFNNLLTAILGYADMLATELPAESGPRVQALQILRAAQRAADLTRRLLAFARKRPVEPRVFDLRELVTAVDALLRRLIGEDIELVAIVASQPVLVEADPGELEQVLINLAVNARQAMPSGGKLTVEVSSEAGSKPCALLSVSDTGVGMEPSTLARLFEPFFTTKSSGEGTGLGLSICNEIVRHSGGSIRVESEPGLGSLFHIRLPLASAARADRLHDAHDESTPGGGETVLVVEDEPLVRQVAVAELGVLGYRVLVARSAEEAVALARGAHPPVDVLLTDLVLPMSTGLDVARRVRELQPGVRVLYVSGYSEVDPRAAGEGAEGAAFLAKPFTARTLGVAMRSLLRAPAPAARSER
jgi:two-component system cell cycle sensor histidine kinase/response regulator CckA